MRLFQNVLGKEFEQGNAALRDAGRKLSPVRDSQAMIEMFDELYDKYRDDLGDRSLVSIRDGLTKRNKSLAREFQQKRIRGVVLKALRTFVRRVDKWDVKKADLVRKAWPEVLRGYEAAAEDLEGKLGDDHNLAVMRDAIRKEPNAFGKEEDATAFLKIVDDRQKKLRSDCRTLAGRLYSEKPKFWRRRIELCWTAWKDERG
jgi:hypothetical protein